MKTNNLDLFEVDEKDYTLDENGNVIIDDI